MTESSYMLPVIQWVRVSKNSYILYISICYLYNTQSANIKKHLQNQAKFSLVVFMIIFTVIHLWIQYDIILFSNKKILLVPYNGPRGSKSLLSVAYSLQRWFLSLSFVLHLYTCIKVQWLIYQNIRIWL